MAPFAELRNPQQRLYYSPGLRRSQASLWYSVGTDSYNPAIIVPSPNIAVHFLLGMIHCTLTTRLSPPWKVTGALTILAEATSMQP
jgi:hypothetical protein